MKILYFIAGVIVGMMLLGSVFADEQPTTFYEVVYDEAIPHHRIIGDRTLAENEYVKRKHRNDKFNLKLVQYDCSVTDITPRQDQ